MPFTPSGTVHSLPQSILLFSPSKITARESMRFCYIFSFRLFSFPVYYTPFVDDASDYNVFCVLKNHFDSQEERAAQNGQILR